MGANAEVHIVDTCDMYLLSLMEKIACCSHAEWLDKAYSLEESGSSMLGPQVAPSSSRNKF